MAVQIRYAVKDAIMGKQIVGGTFSGWNGADNHMPAGASAGTGSYKYRSLVAFNIDFTDMTSINSAKLYLYHSSSGSNLHCEQADGYTTDLIISRVTKDWAEGTYDPGEGVISGQLSYDWDNRHDAFTTDNQVTRSNISQTGGDNGTPLIIDVTDIVKDWFVGRANYGFMIRNDNETNKFKGIQFFSRSAANSTYRPTLKITYNSNTAPGPATLDSPNDGDKINSLTPTLVATSHDADQNDYVTSAEYNVWQSVNKYTLTEDSDLSDPGSGNLTWYLDVLESSLSISKIDKNGNPLLIDSEFQSSLSIDAIDGTSLRLTNGVVTDNGTYYVIVYDTLYSAYDFPPVLDGKDVYLFKQNVKVWESGRLKIDNQPVQFSAQYGINSTTATPLSKGSMYRWNVAYADKADVWSGVSAFAYFRTNADPNAPTIKLNEQPDNDIKILTPTFVITHNDNDPEDSNMYGYYVKLEVLDGSTWSAPMSWNDINMDISGSPASYVNLTLSGGILDWGKDYRITAYTSDVDSAPGPYAPWYYFSTHQTGAPTGMYPTAGAVTSSSPYLSGKRSSSYDTLDYYSIVLQDNTTSGGPYDVINGTFTSGISATYDSFSKQQTGLSSGYSYRWQARVHASAGGYSDWSDWNYFTVADASTPYISSPRNVGTYTLTPLITIERTASTFNSYEYEIYPSDLSARYWLQAYSSGSASYSKSHTYNGDPLYYSRDYYVRARVSSNGGSTWSSWSAYSPFTTEFADPPTLDSVDGIAVSSKPWITSTQPTFVISKTGSYNIDKAQVLILDDVNETIVLDSGLVDVTNAASASIPVTGEYLTRGNKYYWKAQYQDTLGRTSPYVHSGDFFHVNAMPDVPSNISPESSGGVYGFRSGEQIIFKASYTDKDEYQYLDAPTGWYIIIEGQDNSYNWSTLYTKSINPSSLPDPKNPYYEWTNADYSFVNNTTYQWRTYFRDSKGEAGAYTSSNAFVIANPPNGTFTAPSPNSLFSASIQSTLTPTLTWSVTGAEQQSFKIRVEEIDYNESVLLFTDVVKAGTMREFSSIGTVNTYTFSNSDSYFKNDSYYRITLTARDVSGVSDPTPSVVYLYFNTASPSGIKNVRSDAGNGYSIIIEWDKGTVPSGQTFSSYKIYRKLSFDTTWNLIGKVKNYDTTKYEDWYAGNRLDYIYKVTICTKLGNNPELESPDYYYINSITLPKDPGQVGADVFEAVLFSSTIPGSLNGDVWQFIPFDRNRTYMQELPVIDSSYNKVIQQESFETLGSNRKTIIRGFVLGDEGSITCIWNNRDVPSPADAQVYINETIIGRRLLDYISRNKGPHILKSPFGDVWEVQFEGPEITWMPGGILQASVSWVETGTSGEVEV